MSVVALICLPLVLLYQGWTYHVFRHRVGGDAPTATVTRPRGCCGARGRHACCSAVDAALGVGAALLVLARRCCSRGSSRGRSTARRSPRSRPSIVLLVAVFAARALLAWGFEVAGRRGAATILSQLRLDLVSPRLRAQPAALDGDAEQRGRVARGRGRRRARDGVRALSAAGRPRRRRAGRGARARRRARSDLGRADAADAAARAGLHVARRPLHRAARARAVAGARDPARAHFLDVVRGLPTLRAFNRGEAQTERIEQVGDEYRRTTMATLRVAFLSGSVLELAATLGVALVAVTVGVRLVDGAIRLRDGARPCSCSRPSCTLPLRNLAAQYHASADGLAVAERLLELIEAPPLVADGAAPRAEPARRGDPARGRLVRLPVARAAPCSTDVDLELAPGRDRRARRRRAAAARARSRRCCCASASPTAGRITVGGVDLAGCDAAAWRAQIAWVPQRPDALPRHRRRQHPSRRSRRRRTTACARPRGSPAPTRSSRRCRDGYDTRRRRRRPPALGRRAAADRARARVPPRRAAA